MLKHKTETKIVELEKLAKLILKTKKEVRAKRPIVMEFCGTPKSGKSSCVSSLNLFLKRNGFKTKVLEERASICPISDKFNPSFNLWNFFSSTAELLENFISKSEELDVIICDRGIFDCLAWFQWFKNFDHISSTEFSHITNFMTLSRFKSMIDIVYIFSVTPSVALDREYAHLLTRKQGSIMNEKVLNEYNDCLLQTSEIYQDNFRCINKINTEEMDQNAVSYKVSKEVLNSLYELIIEKVAYIDQSYLNKYEYIDYWDYDEKLRNVKIDFDYRDKVNINLNYIQPLPLVVFTDKEKKRVLVAKKKAKAMSKQSPEKDKLLLYFGGHIRKEDSLKGNKDNLFTLSKQTLFREISEELSVNLSIPDEKPFFIWLKNHPTSKRHLALCYIYFADFEHFKFKLDDYEFVQTTGTSKSGRIFEVNDLDTDLFEDWSKIILKKVFNLKLSELDFYREE